MRKRFECSDPSNSLDYALKYPWMQMDRFLGAPMRWSLFFITLSYFRRHGGGQGGGLSCAVTYPMRSTSMEKETEEKNRGGGTAARFDDDFERNKTNRKAK